MRVDAHFHIWDLESYRFPWLQDGEPAVRVYGNSAPLRQSYHLSDYLADARPSGIEAGVYVQCGMQDPLEEARVIQAVSDDRRDFGPIMIVGLADMTADSAETVIEQFAEVPNVRGIRASLAFDPDPARTFAAHPTDVSAHNFVKTFAKLGELGLRLDCMLYPTQMQQLSDLCGKHTKTPVVINHTGLPFEAIDPGLERWRDGMRLLATHPQVCVKISGLGMLVRDWTASAAAWSERVIDETIEIFGEDRCMFASNYPVERLASSYAAAYQTYEAAVRRRSETAKRKLFGENALRLYGFSSR